MKRIVRVVQLMGWVGGAWLGLFIGANVMILAAGVLARWHGDDPRLDDGSWPPIRHLRMVDDHLLVGGQTSVEDYRGLAEHGVTTVVDVRWGGATDPGQDDPEALAEMGMEYIRVPIPDGRAPTPAQIRRFLEAVDNADGRVFAHCGGGVGRSTSLAAAYEASKGQNPSVGEQLATGPPTLEQIWFVASLSPDHPEHSISPAVAVFSRIVDAPRTLYGWVTSFF